MKPVYSIVLCTVTVVYCNCAPICSLSCFTCLICMWNCYQWPFSFYSNIQPGSSAYTNLDRQPPVPPRQRPLPHQPGLPPTVPPRAAHNGPATRAVRKRPSQAEQRKVIAQLFYHSMYVYTRYSTLILPSGLFLKGFQWVSTSPELCCLLDSSSIMCVQW